jgi:hypothetical protein
MGILDMSADGKTNFWTFLVPLFANYIRLLL